MALSLKDEFDALSKYSHMLEGNGRITSADLTHMYDHSMVHQRVDIASSAMTTNKPAGDGFINTYFWDNNGKHNAQIWFPNNINLNGGHPQVRYQGGSDTWSAWTNLALAKDFNGSMYIATCNTAAATAAKVVTVSDDQNFALKKGAIVAVKFTNTNTASTPTINVNSTGAKNVWYNNASYTGTSNWVGGYASKYTYYVYDGTYWCWLSMGSEADSTYSTMSVSEGTTGTATTARTMRADYLKQIIESYIATKTDSALSDSSTNPVQNKIITRFADTFYPAGGTNITTTSVNLNTTTYLKVGRFYCASSATAATFTNCPISTAFYMDVYSPISTSIDTEASPAAWTYRLRYLYAFDGSSVWVQFCDTGSGATWNYGAWHRIDARSNAPVITMTNTDPGAGSALAANNFVAVYGASDGQITANDMASNSVATASLQDYSVTRVKLNHLDLVNSGEWVCIGYAYASASTSSTVAATVTIPADYQGQRMQYMVVGAYEVTSVAGANKYTHVEVQIGGAWASNVFYSSQRIFNAQWEWYGASGSGGYDGTSKVFGHEWLCAGDWDSCSFDFFCSSGYPGSHWSWTGKAGGMSGGRPGQWTGGGRVQNGNAIQGFRLCATASLTWGAGSGFAVYARRKNF